jgi:hypothetical protein
MVGQGVKGGRPRNRKAPALPLGEAERNIRDLCGEYPLRTLHRFCRKWKKVVDGMARMQMTLKSSFAEVLAQLLVLRIYTDYN